MKETRKKTREQVAISLAQNLIELAALAFFVWYFRTLQPPPRYREGLLVLLAVLAVLDGIAAARRIKALSAWEKK